MGTSPIQRYVEAARACIASQNWYAALTLSLTLPDICSALEDPGVGKVSKRYTGWARRYLEPKFTCSFPSGEQKTFLSAENIFQARNSIVHEGVAEIDKNRRKEIDRFEFFSDGSHMNYVETTIDGIPQPRYLQLRVDLFCESIFEAVAQWEGDVADNPAIQNGISKLLKINERGTSIGGIHWG